MKRQTIAVSGAAGMIGGNFVDWLIENKPEYEIVAIDNLFGGYLENVNPKAHFYLRDAGASLTDIFEKFDVKYFYSFHSFSAEGFSPFVSKFNYTNNLVSLANITNECVRWNVKLIFASSMSVYGDIPAPFKETDICNPIDPYAIGKWSCQQHLKAAHQQFGLKYAILIPHNVVGLKQNIWDMYRNAVGIWMRQTINGQPLTIYGDGLQTRAFSWVEDYFEPFWKVAENDYPNPIWNCGGDDFITILDAANLVKEVTGIDTGTVHLQPRHEVRTAWCDHSKLRNELGFQSTITIKEMFTKMWNWAKTQPNRPIKTFENIELEVGLYDFWKK